MANTKKSANVLTDSDLFGEEASPEIDQGAAVFNDDDLFTEPPKTVGLFEYIKSAAAKNLSPKSLEATFKSAQEIDPEMKARGEKSLPTILGVGGAAMGAPYLGALAAGSTVFGQQKAAGADTGQALKEGGIEAALSAGPAAFRLLGGGAKAAGNVAARAIKPETAKLLAEGAKEVVMNTPVLGGAIKSAAGVEKIGRALGLTKKKAELLIQGLLQQANSNEEVK